MADCYPKWLSDIADKKFYGVSVGEPDPLPRVGGTIGSATVSKTVGCRFEPCPARQEVVMKTEVSIKGICTPQVMELKKEFDEVHRRIRDARYALVDGNVSERDVPYDVLVKWFDYLCGKTESVIY